MSIADKFRKALGLDGDYFDVDEEIEEEEPAFPAEKNARKDRVMPERLPERRPAPPPCSNRASHGGYSGCRRP